MQLVTDIRAFYFAHLAELAPDQQFHFCSRLHAWEHDPQALEQLKRLRTYMLPDETNKASLKDALEEVMAVGAAKRYIAEQLRAPYFAKYPQLKAWDMALFRAHHWLYTYGVDARGVLQDMLGMGSLYRLRDALLADADATRVLSTHAVNDIYLIGQLWPQNSDAQTATANRLYEIGQSGDRGTPDGLMLFIYLYTHCIIAATHFYKQPLPDEALPVYRRMLTDVEAVIVSQYDTLRLDTKLEFLVCCRIMGYESPLRDKIYAECEQSVSDQGTFLIDRRNAVAGHSGQDIGRSEHRNVLFIMSSTPYHGRPSDAVVNEQ